MDKETHNESDSEVQVLRDKHRCTGSMYREQGDSVMALASSAVCSSKRIKLSECIPSTLIAPESSPGQHCPAPTSCKQVTAMLCSAVIG